MNKTLIALAISILILTGIAEATVSDLAMMVGKDQGTRLLAGNDQFQQAAQMYNLIENPKAAALDLAAQQALNAVGPDLRTAYTAINNPYSYAQEKIMSEICKGNDDLCKSYQNGLKAYSAVKNPTATAQQYALQEIAKQDPKVGGALTQAYIIKGYVDVAKSGPAERGNDAAAASQRELPKASPITGKAVADQPFGGKFATESIGNCLIGFSATKTDIGDIKNCQAGNAGVTDISLIFNQKDLVAKLSGKGCTLSKTGTKIYIYNSESCSISVGSWVVPSSGKGTYIVFDKPKDKTEMSEGRFVPSGDVQEFKFEDKGYVVPSGGVLHYKDGKFSLDLSQSKIDKFTLNTYNKGSRSGSLTVQKLGELDIQNTPAGFEFTGAGKIVSQDSKNTVIAKGKITLDSNGEPVRVGERTDALIFSDKIQLAKKGTFKTVEQPKDAVRIKTKDEPVEFSLCGKTDKDLPSINVCSDKEGFSIESTKPKEFTVSHVKSYTAKKDEPLAAILKELKPKAKPAILGRYHRVICGYNLALKARDKNCADINAGDGLLIEDVLVKPKADTIVKIKDRIKVEGSTDLTSLGTTWSADSKAGTIKTRMKVDIGQVEVAEKQMAVEGLVIDLSKGVKAEDTIMLEPVTLKVGSQAKTAAKEITEEAMGNLLGPLDLSIDAGTSSISTDEGTGQSTTCGRRGEETGTSVTLTGSATAEEESCSVTIDKPKESPKCETSIGMLICRLKDEDRNLRFEKGKLNGRDLCEVIVEYDDGRQITYTDLDCKRKVTSYIEGDTAKSRDNNKEEFASILDVEYRSLRGFFKR